MIKVVVKNLQSVEVASAKFDTQELAEAWVAAQTASQAVCLWGKLAWIEYVPDPLVENELPTYTEVNHQQEFTVEYVNVTAEVQMEAAKQAYKAARDFGLSLLEKFTIENVMLGINVQESMNVLSTLSGVLTALSNGYLETAIARSKAVAVPDYDGMYITEARLLAYVNEIETYLGIPLSETL